MKYDPQKHHRCSIRLKGYDYASVGAYFVTLRAQDRLCLFGDIVEEEMRQNPAGEMITSWFRELENKYPDVACDEFVVMPNHFHGVIQIVDHASTSPSVGADQEEGAHAGAPLHAIVQWFKTMTTNAYIRGVKHHGWPAFHRRLWQRNYYERIIRNDDELNRAREYIRLNPERWMSDELNPLFNP